MIIKIKLGDLTARQMKAICLNYKGCVGCPLLVNRAKCAVEFGETIPLDYDLEREIEVSTDFVFPNESEPFEKRIEQLEEKAEQLQHRIAVEEGTLRYFAGVLGYRFTEINPRSIRWRVKKMTDDPFPTDEGEYVCPDCKYYDDCKKHNIPTNALKDECAIFERKEDEV